MDDSMDMFRIASTGKTLICGVNPSSRGFYKGPCLIGLVHESDHDILADDNTRVRLSPPAWIN